MQVDPDAVKDLLHGKPIHNSSDNNWIKEEFLTHLHNHLNNQFNHYFHNIKSGPMDHTPHQQPNNPAIFIFCAPRSGSTLLRLMLSCHSQLFAPPELNLLPFQNLLQRDERLQQINLKDSGLHDALMVAGGLTYTEAKEKISAAIDNSISTKAIYNHLQSLIAPKRLVDKSPMYSLRFNTLQNAEKWFANPLYIHLIRSPMAAIQSYALSRPFEKFNLELPSIDEENIDYPKWFHHELIWNHHQRIIEKFFKTVPSDRIFRIRYEDIILNPEQEMKRLLKFLKLPYEESLIDPYAHAQMMQSASALESEHDTHWYNLKPAGDGKVLFMHKKIDPSNIEASQGNKLALSSLTWEIAAQYGYTKEGVLPNYEFN